MSVTRLLRVTEITSMEELYELPYGTVVISGGRGCAYRIYSHGYAVEFGTNDRYSRDCVRLPALAFDPERPELVDDERPARGDT